MTTPDQQTFRDAMACVGAAVNIITTDGPAGMAGFTASAICSVTDSPPSAGLPQPWRVRLADFQREPHLVR